MARTVGDCALLLNAMAGHDPLDADSARRLVPDFTQGLTAGIRGTRLEIPRQHYYEDLEPEVDRAMQQALGHLEGLGAHLEPVDLPHAGDLAVLGNVLVQVEAFGQHADQLRGQSEQVGDRYRRRVACGAFYTAAEYQQALQLRRQWIQELDAALQRVDVLVTPTMPYPAFSVEIRPEEEPDTSWGTRQFNLSGHPALSIPCGFTAAGLPISMQLAGKAFDEVTLFRVAHAYEQSTPWHRRCQMLQEVV